MTLTSKRRLWLGLAASAALLGSAPASAEDNPKVAGEIMDLARTQWAAEIAGRPATDQLSALADDYTEFNPDYPTRIDGRDMALHMASTPPQAKPIFSDMQNPKVQVYGDTAILTYNFAGLTQNAQGVVRPTTAKSTRVYVRRDGRWMLVHANFAPLIPPPGQN